MPASHPQRTHTDSLAADLRLTGGQATPTVQPLAVNEAEAGRLLGLSSRTVFTLRKQGIIKAIKIGAGKQSRVIYPMDELRRFVASAN